MSFNCDDQIYIWLKNRVPRWPQFIENLLSLNSDQNTINILAKFCWVERNYENFAALLRLCILNKLDLPWAYFCEFIFQFKNPTSASGSFPSFFREGILRTNSKQKVTLSPLSKLLGDEYEEYFLYRERYFKQKLTNEKQQLLSEYEIAKFQRLNQEQDRILAELSQRYPLDSQILSFRSLREEEIAAESLSKYSKFDTNKNFNQNNLLLDSEKNEFFNFLIKQMKEKINFVSIETVYEYAIMFEFLEAHDQAIEMLLIYGEKLKKDTNQENLTGHQQRTWRVLDLLVLNKQWVAALNLADELETQFSNLPDVTFSSQLVKAQCLWSLGQPEKATELLKSLLKIRPRFKNGEALLRSWLESTYDS